MTISGFARQFFRNIERENDLREEESKQERQMSVREFGKRRLKIKRKVILSNENNELRIDESGVR